MKKTTVLYFAVIAALIGWISISYWCNQQDDAYIYYSYAHNIANGKGYVFNVGEHVNATTSPLYTLLLAGTHYMTGLELPYIGHAINALSLFFLCLFIFLCLKNYRMKWIVPILVIANPLIYNAVGMETSMAYAIGMAVLLLYLNGKMVYASAVGALSVLSRPDMMALVGVILVYDLIKNKRLPSLKMILVFVAVLLPWVIFSMHYFGGIAPASVMAKIDSQRSQCFASGFVFLNGFKDIPLYTSELYRNVTIFVACVGTAGLMFGVKDHFKNPFAAICVSWAIVYTIVYGIIMNTLLFPWYYVIYSIAIAVLIGCSIERFLNSWKVFFPVLIFSVCVAILVPVPAKETGLPYMTNSWKYKMYRTFAEWMNENAPGKSIACNDIGIIKYYYDGEMVDLIGLVAPGVSEYLKNRDYNGVIEQHKPEYLVLNTPVNFLVKPRGVECVVYNKKFTDIHKMIFTCDYKNGPFLRRFAMWKRTGGQN